MNDIDDKQRLDDTIRNCTTSLQHSINMMMKSVMEIGVAIRLIERGLADFTLCKDCPHKNRKVSQ